jgi:hypothetical protein
VGSMGCWNEPMVGMGCSYATFHPLVCFFGSFTELGSHVDASFVVVCERIQSFQMEKS